LRLQTYTEDYIYYLRSRVPPNSFQPIVASLQLFFSMNDKMLNWDKIKRMILQQVKKSGYLAYQTDDVKKMLEGLSGLSSLMLCSSFVPHSHASLIDERPDFVM
ncbi:MAG: hypothetical protein KGI11_10045, partial [Thaumarchaeota archaeon]|nr:hypothetical protein [Nitrososphaerota archaeon]